MQVTPHAPQFDKSDWSSLQVPAQHSPLPPQLVPSATLLHAVELTVGSHTPHGKFGLGVPGA